MKKILGLIVIVLILLLSFSLVSCTSGGSSEVKDPSSEQGDNTPPNNTNTSKYTIIWKDWNNTVLEIDEEVSYGTMPTYDGTNPTRQNDANYNLIPSFYRTLTKKQLITNKEIEQEYNKYNSLSKKYKSIFGSCYYDYEFYSYMQHAIAYSPFIDFSKSFLIATIFSLWNEKYPNYSLGEAAVFQLNPLNKEKLFINKGVNGKPPFDVQFLKHRMTCKSIIFNKKLIYLKPKDFLSQFSIYDQQSNDRMKVQNGLFLCLNKGLILKNKIIIYTSDFYLVKYIYDKKDASSIYNYITSKFPQFKYENLMDPYLFFKN